MIKIDVQNADLLQALQTLQRQAQNLSEPMADIGQGLESAISLRFDTQTDPDGRQWVKLSDSTLAKRAKAGTTGKKLHEHGTMLQSLSWGSNASSAKVGFGQPYAAYHEWGTKYMPRRGLLMSDPNAGTLGADDLELVLDILRGHLNP